MCYWRCTLVELKWYVNMRASRTRDSIITTYNFASIWVASDHGGHNGDMVPLAMRLPPGVQVVA